MADTNGFDADPIVFMDIAIGGAPLGRVLLRLSPTTSPLTTANFHALCTGTHRSPLPPYGPMGYKGTKFHLVSKAGGYIRGGDISPAHDGTGPPTSIYNLHGDPSKGFANESGLGAGGAGVAGGQGVEGGLFMVNLGVGSGCQFIITTTAAVPRGVGVGGCFGRVVGGIEVVRAIEQTRIRGGGGEGRPVGDVVVTECGEM